MHSGNNINQLCGPGWGLCSLEGMPPASQFLFLSPLMLSPLSGLFALASLFRHKLIKQEIDNLKTPWNYASGDPEELGKGFKEISTLRSQYSPNIVLRFPFCLALVQLKGAQPALDFSAWAEGLDKMTSRGYFQLQPFWDSVKRGDSLHLYLAYPATHTRFLLEKRGCSPVCQGASEPAILPWSIPWGTVAKGVARSASSFSLWWWTPPERLRKLLPVYTETLDGSLMVPSVGYCLWTASTEKHFPCSASSPSLSLQSGMPRHTVWNPSPAS